MADNKCPKCGGRVVNYDDYLGCQGGSIDGTKIFVTACQICGWRKERMGDEMKSLSEKIVENSGLEECEECLTRTRKLIDGLCVTCYEREQNLAPGRRQIQEEKSVNDYFTDVLVCKRCDDEVQKLTEGLCDLCCAEVGTETTSEDDQKEEEPFICAACNRERKHYAKGMCQTCYRKSRQKEKETEKSEETQIPGPVSEAGPVDIAPQKELAEAVPATDHPQEVQQMKSENAEPKKTPPAATVDDAAGVVFTIPKGCKPPLAEIYIHFFDRDEKLLEQLNTAAEMNRRTLANEILFRLDNAQ